MVDPVHPEIPEMPTLEARFWWATVGTTCCVVAAVTEDDARTLLDKRFRDAGWRSFTGTVRICTVEQWRRYQGVLAQTVKWDRERTLV